MSIRILLADDHTIVRHGLHQALKREEDMEVVGEAGNGLQAVQLTRKLIPDMVIMDISMPHINGIDATAEILHDSPQTKIVALSMLSNKRFIKAMFEAGESAYLLKDCDFDELIQAIHIVMSGRAYLTPEITDVILDNYVRSSAEQTDDSVFHCLSKREREVLQLLTEGQTTKQIGLKLHISPKTVEAHRLRFMEKLDINNLAQLTKYAIQQGLTSSDP